MRGALVLTILMAWACSEESEESVAADAIARDRGLSAADARSPGEDARSPEEDAGGSPEEDVGGSPEADATPAQDAAEPEEDAAEPEEDAAEPEEDAAEPEEDAAEPEEDAAEPEEDAGAQEADARRPEPDAGSPDAAEPPAGAGAETCVAAPRLGDQAVEIEAPGGIYTHRLEAALGAADDYNPSQASGLPPSCSPVYDASGHDTLLEVTLQPGERIRFSLTMEPAQAVPALYFVEGCPAMAWPDVDESGLCGDNEYFTEGFCAVGCGPLERGFTWPDELGGLATVAKTLLLVVDEVGGQRGETFTLDYVID